MSHFFLTFDDARQFYTTLIVIDYYENCYKPGTFTTAVGNCKADVGAALPVRGFFNGNAIAITVNFPHCKQVVAMTGHLTANRNALSTLWLDAIQAKDPTNKNWNANITGADYYARVR